MVWDTVEIEVVGSFKIEHPTGSWKCDIKTLERQLKWRYRFKTHQDTKLMKAHSAKSQEGERAREAEEGAWRSHEIRNRKDLWWLCIFSPFASPYSDFAAFGDPCACVGSLGDMGRQEVSSFCEQELGVTTYVMFGQITQPPWVLEVSFFWCALEKTL